MITPGELKVLLSLNGDKRIPELEVEIFSDTPLTYLYLTHMSQYMSDNRPHITLNELFKEDVIASEKQAAWAIYWYCVYFLPNGWPEAEHIISKDRGWYKHYRVDIL